MASNAWDRAADAPHHDVADQQTPVDPVDPDEFAGTHDPSIEADPADVADQQRTAFLDGHDRRG